MVFITRDRYVTAAVHLSQRIWQGNSRLWRLHGSSIPAWNFSNFSGDFHPFPDRKKRKKLEVIRKKNENFLVGILLPAIFRFFLQEIVIFHAISGQILPYTVSGIIDLASLK